MLLVTSSWCLPCKDMKAWMVKNGIEDVEVLDIEKDYIQILATGNSIPVIPTLLDGNDVYVGREQIKPFLAKEYNLG